MLLKCSDPLMSQIQEMEMMTHIYHLIREKEKEHVQRDGCNSIEEFHCEHKFEHVGVVEQPRGYSLWRDTREPAPRMSFRGYHHQADPSRC